MLLREIVTCFTQLCSDLKTKLKPEFVFKGKDRRTHITSPKGVHYQWAPQGSYRIKQISGLIDKLPNRYNMSTEQSFAMYVLDDYSVHLVRKSDKPCSRKDMFLLLLVMASQAIFK